MQNEILIVYKSNWMVIVYLIATEMILFECALSVGL